MRISIPEFNTKSELFTYLKSNVDELTRLKCLKSIKSEDTPEFYYGATEIKAPSKDSIGKSVTKMSGEDKTLGEDEARVKVLANMHGWCDSHSDVLIPGSANKTVNDKGASNKNLTYHLADHSHKTTSIVGGDVEISIEPFDLSVFNIDSDIKVSEALLGASTVKKKYDSKVYHLYLDDEIKNHSIGLRYIKISLCVNSDDEDMEREKENWDKYLKFVINKDKVESQGFFWAVTEYKLLEYSCVLWGSNELTTTVEIDKNIEPLDDDTQNKEPEAVVDTSLTDFLTHLTK